LTWGEGSSTLLLSLETNLGIRKDKGMIKTYTPEEQVKNLEMDIKIYESRIKETKQQLARLRQRLSA